MRSFLNEDLIDQFRAAANECTDFRNSYQNIDGKNKWNILCSAMDWICITARGIKYIKFERNTNKSDDYLSLSLMQYIVAIDVLVEAIIQLYRVIYGSDRKYPLKEDKSIFLKTITDDLYFTHLRAAFGTHPVNLRSLDGSNLSKNEKFYASWSSVAIDDDDNDFIVYLYSNKAEKTEMFELGLNISKVNYYCRKRYDLLNDLKIKIKEIDNHIKKTRYTV